MVSDFEELGIYQLSRELAKQVYKITRTGEFKYDTRLYNRFVHHQAQFLITLQKALSDKGTKNYFSFYISRKDLVGSSVHK